jgi:cytochrome d ubiquinol oxidase subunit II
MIVYGAAFGNVLEGVGFHYSWTGQYYQDESFLSYLLNPFAVMCGVMSLALSIYQGGTFLMLRSVEPMYGRARLFATCGGIVAAVLFAAGGVWVAHMNGRGGAAGGMAEQLSQLSHPVAGAGAWFRRYDRGYACLAAAP